MKFLGARPQYEDLKILVEDSDAVENNLAKFDSSGNPVDSGLSKPNVSDAVTKKHTQNTDQYLDFGGANQVSALQAKTAYTNNHTHSNKTLLDTYTQSETDLADAVSKKHTQNTDTGTTSTTFQLNSGSSGAKIKDNSGVLEARNSADSAYAIIRSAYPSGDNDVVTKGYVDGIPKYDQQARAMALWGL